MVLTQHLHNTSPAATEIVLSFKIYFLLFIFYFHLIALCSVTSFYYFLSHSFHNKCSHIQNPAQLVPPSTPASCLGGGSGGVAPQETGPNNAAPPRVHAPFVVCHCGNEAVIRTSRQPGSYGDTFYGCALGKAGCNYFSWCYLHTRTQDAARMASTAAFCERERDRDADTKKRSPQACTGASRPITPSMRALLNARSQYSNPSRPTPPYRPTPSHHSSNVISNRATEERHRMPPTM
jgi:hypothetical protein